MAIKTYKRGSKEKLSKNFSVAELLCKGSGCCKTGKVDEKLVEILQNIRDHFEKPVHISSAYRCSKWNKAVGGVSGSYHLYGQAADIKVEDVAPADVAKYAESIGVLGIGLYETDADGHFVHIDTRTKKSFWYGQGQARRSTFGGAPATVKTVSVKIPVLQCGSKGDSVRALQCLLHVHYDNLGITGNFGNGTKTMLEKFQKAQGLAVTGKTDANTWNKLLGVE